MIRFLKMVAWERVGLSEIQRSSVLVLSEGRRSWREDRLVQFERHKCPSLGRVVEWLASGACSCPASDYIC